MDERSKKWLSDRKQEQKKKQKEEDTEKRKKEKAAKEAEEKYNRYNDNAFTLFGGFTNSTSLGRDIGGHSI